MKRSLLALVVAGWVWLAAGCGHVDVAPESDPNRVVTGTVNVRMDLMPPPDAELVVRLIDPPDVTTAPASAARDLVIGERGSRENPEAIVAQQVIRAPSAMPAGFRLEFSADETQLRRGFNIEARLSWGGRLRFRNVEAQVVTLGNANSPIAIWMEPVQ